MNSSVILAVVVVFISAYFVGLHMDKENKK